MITFQDYQKADNKTKWLQSALAEYTGSAEYRKAKEEAEYMAGRDTAITTTVKVLYDMTGKPLTDYTAANNRISSNILHRLVSTRCSYSLGNGVSFASAKRKVTMEGAQTVDATKQTLGDKFDNVVYRAAYWACGNGESYTYVHKGHGADEWEYDVFKKTEFLALYDEMTGKLRGGVRFWSLNWRMKPITAVLYTEEGYQRFESADGQTGFGSLFPVSDMTPYIETVQESEADGVEVVGGGNYSTIPIIPLYPNESRASALENLKAKIDALDLALSGFANDMENVAQIYWLVNGAMGADDGELTAMRDRAKLLGILNIDGDHSSVTPYTQEPPYQARETFVQRMIDQIYQDYGCVNVTQISSHQRTATEIEAAFEPMNQEADSFEYQLIEYIQQILGIINITDVPVFVRSQLHNQKEITEMVMLAAGVLDKQTIVEKLPYITVDEREEVLSRIDAGEYSRITDEQPEE